MEVNSSAKKPDSTPEYEKPGLQRYGDVADLTQAIGPSWMGMVAAAVRA